MLEKESDIPTYLIKILKPVKAVRLIAACRCNPTTGCWFRIYFAFEAALIAASSFFNILFSGSQLT